MPATRSTDASEAWRALLMAFTGVHGELAAELEDECGLPIEHYEILLMLYEAGRDGMRPSDIASRRRLSRSGATRLLDRLEQDGLVERHSYAEDRRGNVVSLSTSGKRTFAKAGRIHLDGIERHVASALTTRDLQDLRRILPKLAIRTESDSE